MGDWKTSARAFFRLGEQRRRLMMAVLGVVICAASVALFKQAAFGTDPFQSMCNGLNRVIPISFGTLYVLINAVLLVAVLVFDRHYLGVATLINLFLTGYIVNGGKIGEITHMLYDTLTGIQWGKLDDAFGWTHKI